MKKFKPYYQILSTVIIGVLFIFSAVLKMQSITEFELYIFSFEVFSLNISSVLARVIIGVELALGLIYLLNAYHKKVYYIILASLIGFTVFLVLATFLGREDNCHCFGNIIDISPTESIIKNIVMIVVLILSRNLASWRNPKILALQSYALLAVCAIGLYPMLKYPPRALTSAIHKTSSIGNVNIDFFNEFISKNPQLKWGIKKKVICFYGIGCKYCKYSAQKLSEIVRQNQLNTEIIELVFFGTEEDITKFYKENSSEGFSYSIITPEQLINITNGKMPTTVVFDPSMQVGFKPIDFISIEEGVFVGFLE